MTLVVCGLAACHSDANTSRPDTRATVGTATRLPLHLKAKVFKGNAQFDVCFNSLDVCVPGWTPEHLLPAGECNRYENVRVEIDGKPLRQIAVTDLK